MTFLPLRIISTTVSNTVSYLERKLFHFGVYTKDFMTSTNDNAFRKLNRNIYDVFIIVNDDALDILLDVNEFMNNFVVSALNKQAATATAPAEEFDAFLKPL
jgi:hypothetical protein